jgi:hypothetical protein
MSKILLDEKEIKDLKLDKSLLGANICQLIKISPPEIKSKNIIICISGFM